MSLGLMQQLDRLLGVPLTWLLSRFRRNHSLFLGGRPLSKAPKRVICAKFVGLGSVTLSLPLLRALKEAGVEVVFWTFSGNAQVAQLSGSVDQVWSVKASWTLPFQLVGSLIRAIRFRPEAFIDLEQTSNASAILAFLSTAPVRVGFLSGKPLRESLFTHVISLAGKRHMIESMALMGQAVGVQVRSLSLPPPPVVPLPSRDPARRTIVLNPNTSDLGASLRQWPEASWVALAKQLLRDPAVDLIFPGVASERPRNLRIIEQLGAGFDGRVMNLAGRSSVPELLGHLRTSDLVVSVDSGIMHLAAWAGAPVVGLFGPETPMLYAPMGQRTRVIWAALPCSPCCTVATEKHTRCQDNQCMKRISAGQVYLACQALLNPAQSVPAQAA